MNCACSLPPPSLPSLLYLSPALSCVSKLLRTQLKVIHPKSVPAPHPARPTFWGEEQAACAARPLVGFASCFSVWVFWAACLPYLRDRDRGGRASARQPRFLEAAATRCVRVPKRCHGASSPNGAFWWDQKPARVTAVHGDVSHFDVSAARVGLAEGPRLQGGRPGVPEGPPASSRGSASSGAGHLRPRAGHRGPAPWVGTSARGFAITLDEARAIQGMSRGSNLNLGHHRCPCRPAHR